MSGNPWYKRYPSDAIAGMQGLTLEERGAYNTLIDLIYDRGGPIADDEQTLRAYMGCDVRTWRRVREALINKGKISVDGGLIHNGRAARALTSEEDRANFGRTSGELRANFRPKLRGKSNKINETCENSDSPSTRSQKNNSAPAALAIIPGQRDAPVSPTNGEPAPAPLSAADVAWLEKAETRGIQGPAVRAMRMRLERYGIEVEGSALRVVSGGRAESG